MKLLAVTMELSLVEAAKSSLKERPKVKVLTHSALFPFLLHLLERGTSSPGPGIFSSQGRGHWQGPLKEPKSPEKQVFLLAGPQAVQGCRRRRWSQLVLGSWWGLGMEEKLMI